MTDTDFSICPFIDQVLCFLTYFDFCHNAKIIKEYYNAMEEDAKRFYKWYVYANIHMTEFFKDKIWEYLNSQEPETYIDLIHCMNKYRVK